MTETQIAAPVARQERIIFALRQAVLLGAALLLAGLVTERLRPVEASDRGIGSAPFLWAILLWLVVLLVNALAFERSQMHMLERAPLFLAASIGVVTFIVGMISFDAGELGRRLIYVASNSVGAALFWWAAISLGWLLTAWVSDPA